MGRMTTSPRRNILDMRLADFRSMVFKVRLHFKQDLRVVPNVRSCLEHGSYRKCLRLSMVAEACDSGPRTHFHTLRL